jgi:hypothetical protein
MRREDGGKMDLMHWVERILAWRQSWSARVPVEG